MARLLRLAAASAGRLAEASAETAAARTEAAAESAVEPPSGAVAAREVGAEAEAAADLARQLAAEGSRFRSSDVVRIVGAAGQLRLRHPPLLEAIAAHAVRRLLAYPLFALCNVANGFARLDYRHRELLESVSTFMLEASRVDQLTPIDISSLVFAYAQLNHSAGAVLESCAARLKKCYLEVNGPTCAIILNSYARLGECNPALFRALARTVIQTKPENFDVYHITLIMNAFAKCDVRMPQMMHLLGGYLEGRVHALSPQNVANAAHAFAKLECYSHQLFVSLQARLVGEDLSHYKTFELATLAHSLAKLRVGGQRVYGALFDELAGRRDWDPQAVVQALDAMRRMQPFLHEGLARLLLELFLRGFQRHEVHPLTQGAWCLVELEALELAERAPEGLLERQGEEGASLCLMRMVFERLEELSRETPLTATQQRYVQQLVRSYRYTHEVEYGLLPQRTKAFCKSLFDVPTAVVTSVARGVSRSGPRSGPRSPRGPGDLDRGAGRVLPGR